MHDIAYSKSVLHSFKRIPAKERTRIRAAIADYAKQPEARSHQIKKLKSRNAYRLRIGKWRAIFDLDGNTMRILQVGPRGSIYMQEISVMTNPQIINTPAGEKMAVLPLEEYQRLLQSAEELADIRAYDRVTQQLAAGKDEMIPAEYANRILDGESTVRVWREYRELSVKELAQKANISASYLSQIEGGSRAGSLPTMKALAEALRLELDDLT